MLHSENLRKLDWKIILLLFSLMLFSVTNLISITIHGMQEKSIWNPLVVSHLRSLIIGWIAYFTCSCCDYRKLREYHWMLYIIMLFLLSGLFFTSPIHHVKRWYRLPFFPFDFQPSEFSKLITIISLSCFLEKKTHLIHRLGTFFQAAFIFLMPFILIIKEPDLGSAFILCPTTIGLFYLSGIKPKIVNALLLISGFFFGIILLIFSGILSHENLRPFCAHFMQEYQFERLAPNMYHQRSSKIAISLGHLCGRGFINSEFTNNHWLPYPHTDSVFAVCAEKFGLCGVLLLLALFFCIIYFAFQVAAISEDLLGKFLASGIAMSLSISIILNIGMLCGLLPVTGVPLILISYGGSSIVSTMAALGFVQSIYIKRFNF